MAIQAIKIVIWSGESYGWCALNSARVCHSNGSTDCSFKKASISIKIVLKNFTHEASRRSIIRFSLAHFWRHSSRLSSPTTYMKACQPWKRFNTTIEKSHLGSNAQTGKRSWFTRLNQEITARKVGESSVLELCNVQLMKRGYRVTELQPQNPVQFMTTSVCSLEACVFSSRRRWHEIVYNKSHKNWFVLERSFQTDFQNLYTARKLKYRTYSIICIFRASCLRPSLLYTEGRL